MNLKNRIDRLESRRRPGLPVRLTTNAALRAAGMWLLRENGAYDYHAAIGGCDGNIPDPLPDGCRLISDAEARALAEAGRDVMVVEFVDMYQT